jgi:hypothetical protein
VVASVHGTAANSLAVSVHGPAGVLDLVVPLAASAVDVAHEYAEQCGLAAVPTLCTRLGRALPPDAVLGTSGIHSGDLLVATTDAEPTGPAPARSPLLTRSSAPPGPVTSLWFAVAAGVATLAGWFAGRAGNSELASVAVGLLLLAALLGVVPLGRYARHRALAAPAFGAAAAFAVVWDPHPERLPMVVGITALAGGVTAAVGRALGEDVEEGLRVWMITGGAVFLATGVLGLLGLSAAVSWSVLLVGAMLAARVVPGLAIDVPDQLLIDLERLAVTAWSARDRPRGRRGRAVVAPMAVAAVAARGSRLVTASALAIAAVAVVASAMLLDTVTGHTDRIGARCLVFFAGGALLLAARSYRHPAARALLRAAGLGAWAWLVAAILRATDGAPVTVLALSAIGLALVLVVVAVATGRGWRSAWWARRAEVAEALCGSAALASVFVAVGLFQRVWELTSTVAK